MYPAHIVVSVTNIICGISFLAMLYVEPQTILASALAVTGVAGGLASNLAAILVALVLLVFLAIRCGQGNSRVFLKKHWLGLFNGVFVICFWLALIYAT